MSVSESQPLPTRMVSLTTDDAERIREVEDTVWFSVAKGLTAQDYIESLDMGRTRGVEVEGPAPLGTPADRAAPLAGIYSAWLMGVTVPGPGASLTRLPMSGLTWVGVHPDRRRRGILRQMMTDHLHGVHEAGETPVAGLHASEPGIYGRFGYGPASSDVELTMGRGVELRAGETLDSSAAAVSTSFVSVDSHEATRVLHEVHLAAAEHTLGAVTRGDDVAASWFRDYPSARGEKEPRRVMFAQRGETVTGYAVFRRISKWGEDNQPAGEVLVPEIGAVDSGSLLALGRRMLDFDLTTTVKLYSRSIDDPLLWWAGGPRAVGVRTSDGLWVRLVDVDRALSARGYSGPADVVLEVTDELCAWNAGRWRLTADADGTGRCVATDDDAEVRLPVQALGAAYLGGRSIAAQAATGQVTELREGAVRELSRAMRADTEPFGAIGF